jgi:signal peptidase I
VPLRAELGYRAVVAQTVIFAAGSPRSAGPLPFLTRVSASRFVLCWPESAGLSACLLDSAPVAESRQRPGGRRLGWIIFWMLSGVAVVALAGGVAMVLLTARTFSEPSTSMENTVRLGDVVVVARTTQVRRGDVIIDRQTSPATGYYLRRVIGLPGDHVACCDARGRVTVNGKPLRESYLYPGDAPSEVRFKTTVPKGDLWLLGDHRSVSYDSRELGPLHVHVVGRVFLVLGGGHSTFLRTPQTFVADGLAPADHRTPPALAGAEVSSLALVLLVALTAIGIACYATGRRRQRGKGEPPPAGLHWTATPPPGSPFGG